MRRRRRSPANSTLDSIAVRPWPRGRHAIVWHGLRAHGRSRIDGEARRCAEHAGRSSSAANRATAAHRSCIGGGAAADNSGRGRRGSGCGAHRRGYVRHHGAVVRAVVRRGRCAPMRRSTVRSGGGAARTAGALCRKPARDATVCLNLALHRAALLLLARKALLERVEGLRVGHTYLRASNPQFYFLSNNPQSGQHARRVRHTLCSSCAPRPRLPLRTVPTDPSADRSEHISDPKGKRHTRELYFLAALFRRIGSQFDESGVF